MPTNNQKLIRLYRRTTAMTQERLSYEAETEVPRIEYNITRRLFLCGMAGAAAVLLSRHPVTGVLSSFEPAKAFPALFSPMRKTKESSARRLHQLEWRPHLCRLISGSNNRRRDSLLLPVWQSAEAKNLAAHS
jgi:hypothetical protein